MIKLWFVPEILVFVREMSLIFDFWGRHAWTIDFILLLGSGALPFKSK